MWMGRLVTIACECATTDNPLQGMLDKGLRHRFAFRPGLSIWAPSVLAVLRQAFAVNSRAKRSISRGLSSPN
jgi:hypothetical protein